MPQTFVESETNIKAFVRELMTAEPLQNVEAEVCMTWQFVWTQVLELLLNSWRIDSTWAICDKAFYTWIFPTHCTVCHVFSCACHLSVLQVGLLLYHLAGACHLAMQAEGFGHVHDSACRYPAERYHRAPCLTCIKLQRACGNLAN